MPAPPSCTPREKRSSEHLRAMILRAPVSPVSRMDLEKSVLAAGHATPDDDDEDADSPSPRGKRPRMLDFNMAATPVHQIGSSSALYQVGQQFISVCYLLLLTPCTFRILQIGA